MHKNVIINNSKFEQSNFKKTDSNLIINALEEMHKEIFLLSNGKIGIKNKYATSYKEYTLTKAELLLTNLTGHPVKIEKNKPFEDVEGESNIIHISELQMIEGTKFSPHISSEYHIAEDGFMYINTFHPTDLLMAQGDSTKQPMAILNLIRHLVNYDESRYWYFIRWLSRFTQTLEKSQVSILFKGTQGSGKGILFMIIQMIFGKQYCKQINGDSLSTNFLGSFIENTLFINFDEINTKTIGKRSFSSFLKALITNDEVTAEKKNKDLSTSTKVYAQTILFSNDEYPIEIEPSDRRFTVFTTGGSLISTNFLGYESYDYLNNAIHDEIKDFVLYLKRIYVDAREVNSVFNTPEKNAMINVSLDNLPAFHQAITTRYLPFFADLQYEHSTLYFELQTDFSMGRINRANIAKTYNALYPSKQLSSKDLLNKLRTLYPSQIFTEPNMSHSGNKHYYQLQYQ